MDDGRVFCVEHVQPANELVFDVVEEVALDGHGRPLAFQLEDNHAGVVSGGKEVEGGVGRHDPEPVVIATERLEGGALGHVPNTDRLVLGVGQDQLLTRVEGHAGHVVVVTAASVDLPSLCVNKQANDESYPFKDWDSKVLLRIKSGFWRGKIRVHCFAVFYIVGQFYLLSYHQRHR